MMTHQLTESEVRHLTRFMNIARSALWNLQNRLGVKDCFDILIVAVIIYELIMLTRKTRGSSVLKGLVLLLLAVGLSNLLGLTSLNWMLNTVIQNGAIVLFILFQPELRKALEQVGRGAFLKGLRTDAESEDNKRIVDEIIKTLTDLSKRRVGALIVFERHTGLNDIIETGTQLNARISAPLLENIFEPNTPLHDGAVIVRGKSVVAAACILTLTDSRSVSLDLGTRHRAGIGVSETTDATVLIVSEETGIISMAKGGQITRSLNDEKLRAILGEMYAEQATLLDSLLHRHKGKEAA